MSQSIFFLHRDLKRENNTANTDRLWIRGIPQHAQRQNNEMSP